MNDSMLLLLLSIICPFVCCWKNYGEYLDSIYFQTLTTIGIQQCAKRCLSHPECKSINFHLPKYSCTLSAFDKNTGNLVQNSEYVYSQIDKMTQLFTDICNSSTCPDEHTCVRLHDMNSHCALQECNQRLHWESSSSITVSVSSTHSSCSFNCAPLDSCPGNSWCPSSLSQNQYLQFSFLKPLVIKGVIIQGRGQYNQWVKTYRVSISDDNVNWTDLGQEFLGNFDLSTWVTNFFERGMSTTYLRIIPEQYHSYKSMRVDLIGC